MTAVFKKEWLGSFQNLIGWIFLSMTVIVLGWYYRFYNLEQGLPYISYLISSSLFIFLFAFSVLTMRSFAAEKRHFTDQLLFTVPTPMWKIVLGKYFAAVCVFLPIILLLIIYMILLRFIGQIPMAENLLSVFCFFCFGCACISVGIFMSAITENQIIAAVMSSSVLLLGAMVPGIRSMIGQEDHTLSVLLSAFDLTAPFDKSLYGIFYLPDYVQYFSVVFIMLALTVFALRMRVMNSGQGLSLKTMGNYLGMLVLILAVGVANLFLARVPSHYVTVDLTYNQIRSLTDRGREMAASLTEDVRIYVMVAEDEKDETIDATLRSLEFASDHIYVEYVDPEEKPYFYLAYTDQAPVANSLIVASSKKSRVIPYYDCYQLSYDYAFDVGKGTYEATDYSVSGYDGEGRVLSAIYYVITDKTLNIACVTGHDELDLSKDLQFKIENAMYRVESIDLSQHEEIPSEVDILMILGPFKDFSKEDVAKVRDFMNNGNDAVFVCAYTDAADPENYYGLLKEYGIEVLPGAVAEQDNAYYNGQNYYLLPEIHESELTVDVYTPARMKYIYMPYSKGLKIAESPDIKSEVFLSSTENAKVEAAPGETGPFTLGAYLEKFLPVGKCRIAVFASDYFLYDEIDKVVNGNNFNLFIRVLNKVSQMDTSVDIPVKSYSYDILKVSDGVRGVFSVLFIGIIPLLLLVAGGFIWYDRRRK